MPEARRIRQMVYRLYQLIWAGLDWLFPPLCGGCEKLGERWCGECQASIHNIPESVCQKCGQLLSRPGLCSRCMISSPSYTSLRSWAFYSGPLRKAIHRLKYQGDIALGEILSRPLITWTRKLDWGIDAVVPVPIGMARKAERGYNQAAILALPLALGCAIPYRPGWLQKIRETRSQVGLTRTERHENVRAAFTALPGKATGKKVLVVDDVATSGATMEACASALLSSGAREVYGLTLARAVYLDVQDSVELSSGKI